MFNGLRNYYVEALTSCGYLSLLALALHFQNQRVSIITLALVAVIGLLAWVSTYKRVRTIADIATSRIGSAAQGYVELYGRASVNADNLIKSPLSGIACIWFRYWVYTKDNSEREWRELSKGVSESMFEISDSSGKCDIDPDDAEIISPDRRVSYEGNYKYVEDMLFAGGFIYVLGQFTTLGGANSVLSVKEDVNALLTDWKKNPTLLKKRFDLDGNGEIDVQEWELARRQAFREVEQQHRELRSAMGVHVIRAPKNGRLFLISSMSPQKLRFRYLLWSYFHLATSVLAASAIFWL